MYWSNSDPFNVLPNPYYWAGNEPDILAPWLFNFAGAPQYTQKFTREQIYKRFTTAASGLPGNDDYGTMSAWFIFAAVGFYPVSATDNYVLGSPLFSKVILHTERGPLTIIANNISDSNIYVKSATLNGQQINYPNQAFIQHSKMFPINNKITYSTLTFEMTDRPPYADKDFDQRIKEIDEFQIKNNKK